MQKRYTIKYCVYNVPRGKNVLIKWCSNVLETGIKKVSKYMHPI